MPASAAAYTPPATAARPDGAAATRIAPATSEPRNAHWWKTPRRRGFGSGPGGDIASRLPARAGMIRAVPNRRPRLEIVGTSASPQEAAAVIAAVERFLRDTAPPPAPAPPPASGWVGAARREAVDRLPADDPWG